MEQQGVLQQQFEQAVNDSKELTERPSNEMLLKLYSLYKQAAEGDAPEKGEYVMFDFVAKAKHEAWRQLKGIGKHEAMRQYIDLVNSLKQF